ncbi:malto-oligosyltrehalose synthase [Flaviaesturariibacter amylovorans]|uniref:4-alpha-glucanotransferase n=1 Tax=Flaviaesturariibacter amylovorans TaxID=1084520 RepID=A0ABP8GUE1_9BACT
MYNPIATYRIQFHKDFTFRHLEAIIPYLRDLGIKTIYASPIFTATPGSTHGYDALNPLEINPEIGTLEELRALRETLRAAGIGWMQDIVPNHMAYDTRNPWLRDVLRKGRQSVYAGFFDVTWNNDAASGHIMAPFLGAPLEDAVRGGEIRLHRENGEFQLRYYDAAYPLRLRSYEDVLRSQGASEAVNQWLRGADDVGALEDAAQYSKGFDELLLQLASLSNDKAVGSYIDERVAAVNADPEALLRIANDQVYRLCHWQETDGRINYRRFFTVNGLICLNMQDEHVFDTFHTFIKQLIDEGIFDALRIDHVDGLYDPAQYLVRLRALVGPEVPIVVEKILELHEELPQAWPIEGTSGYEFLAQMNQLLTDTRGEAPFSQYYSGIVQEQGTVPQQVRDKKAFMLYHHMGGELENLYQLLMQQLVPEQYAQMRTEDLKTAIAELLIHMPVYRYYGNALPLPKAEGAALSAVFAQARISRADLAPALHLLEATLLGEEPDAQKIEKKLHLYKRLMQLSGPLMAKGVEDTLMYTYNRFIGHNEVGDAPGTFGWTTDAFHRVLRERQAEWPLTLNATSTHDTKRGEDVRARLQVLSSLSEEWLAAVTAWEADRGTTDAPDANDAYFLYQTLIASYPLRAEDRAGYEERIAEYLQKALREAKLHSNWTAPNEAYEAAAKSYASRLLAPESPFQKGFAPLYEKVADLGIVHSLAQVLLKFTAPGVPDVYQGCEWWDESLVDPDNRRPVDYDARKAWLQEVMNVPAVGGVADLWKERRDGRIKLWLTHQLLQLRAASPDLFQQGAYLPLQAEGTYKDNVFAFARRHGGTALIVVVPLCPAALVSGAEALATFDWKDTAIQLPAEVSGEWTGLLDNKSGTARKTLPVNGLFDPLPFALLRSSSVEVRDRSAGLLLHISSLPSPFGIGDLGPEAYSFLHFLQKAKQRYWQLLPLTPTEAGQGHSPYSSTSSRAGNILFISPELLVEEGLLLREELQEFYQSHTGSADYSAAEAAKKAMLEMAWNRFRDQSAADERFAAFREREAGWLPDFARYQLLKELNDGKPWYEWEEALRLRDPATMARLDREHAGTLDKFCWQQYVFDKQWNRLKASANERGIRLIGDLPFYVSYDSSDVWADRALFLLDEAGQRLGLAGVPPDAFSSDGQLWGMPVFRWDVLKARHYDWWVERLQRNIELFDLVRLDHFRAFAAYWEVPAGATTARNGTWKEGPGADFFDSLKEQLGALPFVAEDLGDIDDAVLELRDRFDLPGMKVLQFAFGEDLPESPHIPHNYREHFLAYTGTHDNNTTKGWWRQEASTEMRERLGVYAGYLLNEDDVPPLLCRMALASLAQTAILPVQDLLGLDETARMNTPAQGEHNWGWRLLPGQLDKDARRRLRQWTELYNRS